MLNKRAITDRRSDTRDGLTLVEVLVALGVVVLLLAIVVPAVQNSRAASRRLQCQSRLKEIGLALSNFESANQAYPNSYKWRIEILPYLGEEPLAEQFDLLEERSAGRTDGLPESWSLERPVTAFVCPSETAPEELPITNYYANMGSGLQAYGFNGFISPEIGQPFYYGAHNVRHLHGVTRPADFRDGLSNTVAVSEAIVTPVNSLGKMRAGNATRQQLLSRFWDTEGILIEADKLPELAEQCRKVRERDAPNTAEVRGRNTWPSWRSDGVYWGALIHSWAYDHVLPPNSPSCGGVYWSAIFSASSYHSGGVNVVFGDGSVRFVSETIDGRVWTALGTRSGDEQTATVF